MCIGSAVATAVLLGVSDSTFARIELLTFLAVSLAGIIVFGRRTTSTEAIERTRRVNDVQLAPLLAGQNFSDRDLPGMILRSRRLDGTSFARATIAQSDFTRASLVNVDMANTDARACRFEHADLHHATLRNANLSDSILTFANLVDADLRGANLYGADLRDADLSGADLCGADLRDSFVNRTVLDHATYDAATQLPYNITSDRRLSAGLEPTADSRIQPADPKVRRRTIRPSFVAASMASAAFTLGLVLLLEPGTAAETQVAGKTEFAPVDDGRALIIDADGPVQATLTIRGGGEVDVVLHPGQTIGSLSLQTLERIRLQVSNPDDASCTLTIDGRPVAVARSTTEQLLVDCPLDAP